MFWYGLVWFGRNSEAACMFKEVICGFREVIFGLREVIFEFWEVIWVGGSTGLDNGTKARAMKACLVTNVFNIRLT